MEYNPRTLLAAVFASSLIVANVTASKLAFFTLPVVGGVAVPAGFLAIGVAFLCSDLLGELYGREVAHDVVNGAVLALGAGWVLIYASVLMPAAPFYEHAAAFDTIMSASGAIILASLATTLVSQHVDVSVFHYLRTLTDGRHRWVRNVGSTGVSQFVDTALFIVLGFGVFPLLFGGSAMPAVVLAELVVAQYVVKLLVVAGDTPIFYAITALVDAEDEPDLPAEPAD